MTNKAKVVAINFSELVDRLGELNALIAPLADEISGIKETLRASGYEVVEGKQFRVTIGETREREYIDWESLARANIRATKLQHLLVQFAEYKQALGAVRCVAKVR